MQYFCFSGDSSLYFFVLNKGPPSGDKATAKPIPAKRSRSPAKKQPLRTSSWSTASFRHTPRRWPEDHRDDQKPGPKIYRAPPTLDLSTLTDATPVAPESDSNRSPGKSPTSQLAVIKVQAKEGEPPMSEGERQNLKRDTCVYVVRSHSDASPRKQEVFTLDVPYFPPTNDNTVVTKASRAVSVITNIPVIIVTTCLM